MEIVALTRRSRSWSNSGWKLRTRFTRFSPDHHGAARHHAAGEASAPSPGDHCDPALIAPANEVLDLLEAGGKRHGVCPAAQTLHLGGVVQVFGHVEHDGVATD